jgi:hypothetical protein
VSGLVLLVVPIALSAVVIVAAIAIVIVARRQRPLLLARQQAITARCAQRGLVAQLTPDDFAILGRIDRSWLTNGHALPDHSVAVADFVQPAGKHTAFFSMLAFTITGVNVPYVAVWRRGLTGITVGGPPTLELESTEFDKQFMVKARDRRSATMLLDPGVMQLLLDCEQVNFDMDGNRVLAYVNRAAEAAHAPAEPVEFELLFRFLDGFVARAPSILRSEYPAQP